MPDPGPWTILAAVLAPLAFGIATLALPARSTALRPVLALIGFALPIALAARWIATGGIGAPVGSAPLIPELALALAFRLDALSVFFAMLILGIGSLITIYARAYFGGTGADAPNLRRFYPILGFFATAMLGLVLSDSMLLVFVFWELTSISSFLLIGWDRADERAVRLAMQAFFTTGLGGMALLGGILLLGTTTGAWTFSALGPALATSADAPLLPWAFALIFLGAAAKSAQWPLHFWLPGAMAAPTPVSAYLHSATMVKAGVYLLARLEPEMHSLTLWGPVLTGFGAITLLLGAVLSLRSVDLKRVFAYSTVSQLGLFVCGYGLASFTAPGQPSNLSWPIMQIASHALYKAPLFMIAGAIIHATGTSDYRALRGLWRSNRILALLCLLGLACLMSLPGTLAFAAKEVFLDEIIRAAHIHPVIWAVGAAAILGAACNAAIAVRFARTFLARADAHADAHHHVHDRWAWCLWGPAAFLLAWQLIGGLAPSYFERIIAPVETNTLGFDHLPSIWHAIAHPNLTLGLTGASLALGIALGCTRIGVTPITDPHDRLFPAAYRAAERLGRAVIRATQPGNLRVYTAVMLAALVGGLCLAAWSDPRFLRIPALPSLKGASAAFIVDAVCFTALICATALILPAVRSMVVRVLVLGSCGFSVVGMYLLYQAPDLALTQLMFEIISVVLFLLVLRLIPEERPHPSDRWRLGRFALGAAVGLTIGWTTLHAGAAAESFHADRHHDSLVRSQTTHDASTPAIHPIAASGAHGDGAALKEFSPTGRLGDWFVAHANQGSARTEGRGGGGKNVVNVILVDFRGYDTMGEITVLAIALIGVLAMLAGSPAIRSAAERAALSAGSGAAPVGAQPHLRSSLLRTAMVLILPLTLIFAGYMFFKGHNEPGGGFVAGLVASVGLAVYRMAEGGAALRRIIPIHPAILAAIGLTFALGTGFLPIVLGQAFHDDPFPLFYSVQMHIPRFAAEPFHLPSVTFFDFGVFLVVVGVSVGMLNRFEEELDA